MFFRKLPHHHRSLANHHHRNRQYQTLRWVSRKRCSITHTISIGNIHIWHVTDGHVRDVTFIYVYCVCLESLLFLSTIFQWTFTEFYLYQGNSYETEIYNGGIFIFICWQHWLINQEMKFSCSPTVSLFHTNRLMSMPKSVVATWLFAYIPEKKYVMTLCWLWINYLLTYHWILIRTYRSLVARILNMREVFSRLAKSMLHVRN
jgi:hypothetical protein